MVPRPGIEPGLKIRTKQDQNHQKKVNSFAELCEIALSTFVLHSCVFRRTLPKFCPRILTTLPRESVVIGVPGPGERPTTIL
jgi:hypothetical protein